MHNKIVERKYPNLSRPLAIGNVILRNRIISGPMSFPDIPRDESLSPAASAFYELRAKGGAASVTVSECVVHPQTGKSHSIHIDIDAPGNIRSFSLAANAIRRHGAVACIQLSHGGMYGGADSIDKSHLSGTVRYGASDLTLPNGTIVTEMPVALIHEIVESYGKYAALCKRAGFNMIMVHAGHGWLLHQFLTPLYNFRTDKYGGSLEGRVRFLSEVLDSIRDAVGPDFPIELRISGSDFTPGGLEVEDSIKLVKLIEDKIHLLHVSAGIFEGGFAIQHPSMFHERGCNVWLAAEMKKHVSIPVATVGGISDPEMMEEIIASGKADVIVMARALLADPYLPTKVCEGRIEEIVPCFRCLTCHAGRMVNGLRMCAVNPVIGREEENRHVPLSPNAKKVLVAGGGPGGLMAAITAAKRGHSVILCEKESALGGALRAERNVPFKKDLFELPEKYGYLAKMYGVDIRLKTEVTPEFAAIEQPDVLICAVGAMPLMPRIPGIERTNVIMGTDLSEASDVGQNVVVIGGGLVGCEMGLHLALEGRHVTIVEMQAALAPDANPRHRPILLEQLNKYDVKGMINTSATEINNDGVVCADEAGNKVLIKADSIVCAAGMKPLRDVVDALRDCAPLFIEVGDCVSPANVIEATTRGYYAALDI
ncbi:MAG: FAD-dependent oxidoreductase [Oscillospiraceae bacterium]|nr:FAD-dependent oxidoreductase [Oscillospiraceae bacterium]